LNLTKFFTLKSVSYDTIKTSKTTVSRYCCESLFWASKPTTRQKLNGLIKTYDALIHLASTYKKPTGILDHYSCLNWLDAMSECLVFSLSGTKNLHFA